MIKSLALCVLEQRPGWGRPTRCFFGKLLTGTKTVAGEDVVRSLGAGVQLRQSDTIQSLLPLHSLRAGTPPSLG